MLDVARAVENDTDPRRYSLIAPLDASDRSDSVEHIPFTSIDGMGGADRQRLFEPCRVHVDGNDVRRLDAPGSDRLDYSKPLIHKDLNMFPAKQ